MAEADLNDIAIFVRVVEQGSFAGVARALRVPTSTISRAISRLEQHVGTRLLHRTTRTMQLTDEGRAFHADVAPAFRTIRGALREVEGSHSLPSGRLRVSASLDTGTTFLPRVVVEFAERCPDVHVEVELSSRHVNLVEEGFDLAIRAGPLADSSLVARKLGDVTWALYASAAYLEKRGGLESPAALARHDCVLFRAPEGHAEWVLEGPDGEPVRCAVRGRIVAEDFAFLRAAVMAGGGIGLFPQFLARGDPSARLVRVLPGYGKREGALYAVHPPARRVPAKVSAFSAALAVALARLQGEG